MGSWNGTCGLTNLPIRSGDKIVLFPLIHNKYAKIGSGGFCYPSNQFTFISLPLYGEYDDYGGIENITKNGKEVFDHFMSFLVKDRDIEIDEKEMERQKYFDKDFGTPTNIDDLINSYIERGVYKNIGFMMVLESVFDDVKSFLANERKKNILYGEQFISKHKEWKESDEGKEWKYPFSNHMIWGDDMKGYNESYFARFWSDGGEERNTYVFKYQFLYELANMEDHSQILDSMVDLMLMESTLFATRKFWTIQSGSGSQSESYKMLCVLANSVLNRKKEIIEEMVEDDDWTREEAEARIY